MVPKYRSSRGWRLGWRFANLERELADVCAEVHLRARGGDGTVDCRVHYSISHCYSLSPSSTKAFRPPTPPLRRGSAATTAPHRTAPHRTPTCLLEDSVDTRVLRSIFAGRWPGSASVHICAGTGYGCPAHTGAGTDRLP